MNEDERSHDAKRNAGGLADMMKKAFSAGLGALFLTEESVRSYVAESKLPRDIAKYVIQTSASAKEQFFEYLTKEVSQLIRKSDLPQVVTDFLPGHDIEIEARIRFKRTEEGKIKAELTGTTRAEETPRAPEEEPPAPPEEDAEPRELI